MLSTNIITTKSCKAVTGYLQ